MATEHKTSITEADRMCAVPGFGCGPDRVRRLIGLVEAAEARVRELEAELSRQVDYHCQQTANSARVFEAVEEQLAAANALLAEVPAPLGSVSGDWVRRWVRRRDAHLSAQPATLPCVSGYVGKNGECNDCGQHHAETTNAQWQQAARDAQSDLAVLRTEHAKLKARVEQACSALAEAHPDSQAVLLTMRVLRG